jgi:hypothetical protein
MPRRAPERPDPHELAHRLRGPLNDLLLWTAILEHQLAGASPVVQRALAGLQLAVRQQVALIETLEGAAAAETFAAPRRSEKSGPRHS